MAKSPLEIEKDKTDYIVERTTQLRKKILTLERKLFNSILTDFLLSLDTKDGVILNTGRNIVLINRLDQVFKDFNKEEQERLTLSYADDLLGISQFNERYFNMIIERDREDKERINKRLRSRNLRLLGIEQTKKGNTRVKKNGYLDLFLQDQTIKTQLKRRSLLAIQSGMTVKDLRNTIANDIITTKKKEGLLKRYWRQNAFDTYSGFDRSTGKALADEYELQSALYSAGTENDSRHLCRKQNGKIYLREEIEELRDFANKKRGKEVIGPIVESVSSYNPYIQQGGINCKHSWRWVTNRFALRRDRTLYEEDGVLKRKEGENPNNDI